MASRKTGNVINAAAACGFDEVRLELADELYRLCCNAQTIGKT